MEHSEYSDFLTEADIIAAPKLSNDKKRELVSQSFARTASNGDVNALERVWETCRGSQWVDIDYRDDQGSTPLICASCFGHTHIAELLLEYGASVNLQDNSGWTALMWATTNHNQELVRVLLEHGASSSAKTARGHTAMNIASSNLSSNSDSEGGETGDGESSRLDDSGSYNGGTNAGELGLFKTGETDSISVGSPRSMEHSAIGTPSRRAQARNSLAAGQNVLSMLQASSARSGGNLAETHDAISQAHDHGLLSPTRSADSSRALNEGLGLTFGDSGDYDDDVLQLGDADQTDTLPGRMRALTVGKRASNQATAQYGASDDEDDSEDKEPQAFDWDTLQLDQMYVISPGTVPQFLHAVIKDIQPERWIQPSVPPEHRFVPASMIFLAARFAHHLGTPDFLESFLADTIASIIHEVQTHKADPVSLAFWTSNIHTLVYFFKRDSTLVQITSDAQGRMSECMHDAYALLVKAIEAELEPLVDASLLAFEAMPELFADVKFEAQKSQRLSMFFFGASADATRKSADGRPLRRSQTILQKGGGRPRRSSILAPSTKPEARSGPATAVGEMPQWVATVQQLKGHGNAHLTSPTRRPSSGDTFVSDRVSTDHTRLAQSTAALFSSPSPRTITFMLESLLDLLDMCEIHPHITWGVMRQIFCYLGSETFNRVLTTREFCSRSRAMQIRMNVSQLSDWVRTSAGRLPPPSAAANTKSEMAKTADTLLFKTYFDSLVELLELLQCLTHLPDLAEYFETTAKMQSLNVLQQETVAANYRYEVQETRVASDILEYLDSIAKEIRDGQRAAREKQSVDRASRRSSASVFSDRRTMDGRPALLSIDLTSPNARTASGVVRVLADPVPGASEHGVQGEQRSSGGIPLARKSAEGTVVSRSRTGTRSGRRGLLIPIARTAPSARPSVRTLFPAQPSLGAASDGMSGRTSTSSRASESLEPISEAASVTSRQRSRTTVDSDARSSCSSAGSTRLSNDAYGVSAVQPRELPTMEPLAPPSSAPADGSWNQAGESDTLSASLRGPRGKKCLPENMKELLDSTELLPFAVPTSREWLTWWARGQNRADADWSNETVALHSKTPASHTKPRDDLAPAVPSEFLNVLSQIA
ncbi:hypothetical protein J3F80_000481 [Coemansia sp. RSA 2526]|nr:hypothetical protein J3F80_000481 [Coemansia sp. RSA 2526]